MNAPPASAQMMSQIEAAGVAPRSTYQAGRIKRRRATRDGMEERASLYQFIGRAA